MTQTTAPRKSLNSVGEEISHELGAKMVKDFQDQHPTEGTGNYIGRDILERILEQPGCMGINFYNAINEVGKKTLVYVGVDENEQDITDYSIIDANGKLVTKPGIVADRTISPTEVKVPKAYWW